MPEKIADYPTFLILSVCDDDDGELVASYEDENSALSYWRTINEPRNFYIEEDHSKMILFKAIKVKEIQPVKTVVVEEDIK